jgi:hypothetical protein
MDVVLKAEDISIHPYPDDPKGCSSDFVLLKVLTSFIFVVSDAIFNGVAISEKKDRRKG